MAAEEKEEQKSEGFKVSDKRHFTREGDLLDEGEQPSSPPEEAKEPAGEDTLAPPAAGEPAAEPAVEPKAELKAEPAEEPKPAPEGGPAGAKPGHEGPAPKADFLQVVDFLVQNAAFSLGLIPDPSTGSKKADLVHAGHFIDLISILKDKTKGNLSADEEKVIQEALTQLRSLYLNLVQQEKR